MGRFRYSRLDQKVIADQREIIERQVKQIARLKERVNLLRRHNAKLSIATLERNPSDTDAPPTQAATPPQAKLGTG